MICPAGGRGAYTGWLKQAKKSSSVKTRSNNRGSGIQIKVDALQSLFSVGGDFT